MDAAAITNGFFVNVGVVVNNSVSDGVGSGVECPMGFTTFIEGFNGYGEAGSGFVGFGRVQEEIVEGHSYCFPFKIAITNVLNDEYRPSNIVGK